MRKRSSYFLPGLVLVLTVLPGCAQEVANVRADANAAVTTSAPDGRAPEEATKKITDLVHAGHYADAQKLTAGLLIAYPNDQRLLKAKALIEKLLSPTAPPSSTPVNTPPTQPTAAAEQLTGLDKVDYNALIVLARQAQQTTDLTEQKKLLQQFMDQSNSFLQKHPDQMLLWQLRLATAFSVNEPMAGFEAGQKLLAAGAADSNDPALQQLLGQLKNKGWLEKQEAEKQAQKKMDYLSILGTWNYHLSTADHKGHEIAHADWTIEFSKSDSGLEGYVTKKDGKKEETPWLKGTILDSGEITWTRHWATDWTPVSVEVDNNNRNMKVVFTGTININGNAFNTRGYPELCTFTNTLNKR